jgi:hypothetical protein
MALNLLFIVAAGIANQRVRARSDGLAQLAALFVGPRIGALVDWDDKLRGLLQKAHQLSFGRLHFVSPCNTWV